MTEAQRTNPVALTFDDGPDQVITNRVLNVLRDYRVPATFFCVGRQVKRFPEIAQRMLSDGHAIGNHSWDHPHLGDLTPEAMVDQVEATSAEITRVTGNRPMLFRPPYGEMDERLHRHLAANRYRTVLWDVDSMDWQGIAAPSIVANSIPQLHPQAILLLHTGAHAPGTLDALPFLIEGAWSMGFAFVTVDELLAQNRG